MQLTRLLAMTMVAVSSANANSSLFSFFHPNTAPSMMDSLMSRLEPFYHRRSPAGIIDLAFRPNQGIMSRDLGTDIKEDLSEKGMIKLFISGFSPTNLTVTSSNDFGIEIRGLTNDHAYEIVRTIQLQQRIADASKVKASFMDRGHVIQIVVPEEALEAKPSLAVTSVPVIGLDEAIAARAEAQALLEESKEKAKEKPQGEAVAAPEGSEGSAQQEQFKHQPPK